MRRVGARPRGPLDARELAQALETATCRSEGVQFVPLFTSFDRRADLSRSTSTGIASAPSGAGSSRIPRDLPRRARSGSVCHELSWDRLASVISELASHEVPGFGAPALSRRSLAVRARTRFDPIRGHRDVSASGRQ